MKKIFLILCVFISNFAIADSTVVIRKNLETGSFHVETLKKDSLFKNGFEHFVCEESPGQIPCYHAIYKGAYPLEKCEDFNDTYLKIKETHAPTFELVEKHTIEYSCTGYQLSQKFTTDRSCVIIEGAPGLSLISNIYNYCD